jgi:hypothetical protein
MMMTIMYRRVGTTPWRLTREPRAESHMTERYLEDSQAGQAFGSGRIHIDADRIKSFAAEFDPHSFIKCLWAI